MSRPTAVIGGGFYGCIVALELARQGRSVVLIEAEPALMTRASFNNQARIHMGYHYPRNLATAAGCQRNYQHFLAEFPSAADTQTPTYYAIAEQNSKVRARDFEAFCTRLGMPLRPCSPGEAKSIIRFGAERVYAAQEAVFSAAHVRHIMEERLEAMAVKIALAAFVEQIEPKARGHRLTLCQAGSSEILDVADVYVCAYSGINGLLARSRLPKIPLRHQLTELALVDSEGALPDYSFTLMDGPFFSLLPFPDRKLKTLSHVVHTVHRAWEECEGELVRDAKKICSALPRSRARHMISDAARYIPALGQVRHVDSLWEVKTLLPAQAETDGRPILFRQVQSGLYVVLGSKIDSVNDLRLALRLHHEERFVA